ncbi:HprK-related kinase B [Alteromonadaceae bacterium Bs31]|nr:HprK-related kinase B [Alteromonadaceae bacterium Bs31]
MIIDNTALTVADVQNQLQGSLALCDAQLLLDMGRVSLRVRSNSAELIKILSRYFKASIQQGQCSKEVLEVRAIECPAPSLDVEYQEWQREAGKIGRKDSYSDIEGGRIIRKVRTGMVFLQSKNLCLAAGPCIAYNNQVINFINTQYITYLQQRGWLICHAAALSKNQRGLALAGLSGGGKSSLMLHLLDNKQWNYLTNDRLLIDKKDDTVCAAGIPKLPRINPGTIVNNPRLHALLSCEQHEQFSAMSKEELWLHEEKYDVNIEQHYGENRLSTEAELAAFVVLNWQFAPGDGTQLTQIDLRQRPDLLQAIMKSPGPFHQKLDGSFNSQDPGFNNIAYLEMLSSTPVYEITGDRNFTEACTLIEQLF